MVQILRVKVKTRAGGETTKTVTVLRSWQDASGAQIFLHTNGVHGYKDGAPVRNKHEFAIISNKAQRHMAEMWWERRGKKMSEEYYGAIEEREMAAAGDFQALDATAKNQELDLAMYRRSPAGSPGAMSPPAPWMEFFPARPDWWGQADAIQFSDWLYIVHKGEVVTDAEPPPVENVEMKSAKANTAGNGAIAPGTVTVEPKPMDVGGDPGVSSPPAEPAAKAKAAAAGGDKKISKPNVPKEF